jgi:hypothetical protein
MGRRSVSDVLERIDAVMAEEKCPHCEREWHERPLTRAVARMFDTGRMEADYFTREDKSPVVCDGSYLIGPRRPEAPYANGGLLHSGEYHYGNLVSTVYDATWSYIGKLMEWPDPIFDTSAWTLSGLAQLKAQQWGTYTYSFKTEYSAPWVIWQQPVEEPICADVPDWVDVEFGPQNWLPATEPVNVPPQLEAQVSSRLPKFTAIETHAPKSPGFDFTKFDVESPSYPTGKKPKKGNRYEGK